MEQNLDRDTRTETSVPFHALVEVGGATGDFVAQAVEVSVEGMHIKTAYLPDIGQILTCRFDAGGGANVELQGDVVWREEDVRGGDFGLRFRDLDDASLTALRRIVAAPAPTVAPKVVIGERVRLHIDGLNAPMRGRVKEASDEALAVGSDLSFLTIGKAIEVEDAASGVKRPARIDHVGLSVDAASSVPELVVSLQYTGAGGDGTGGELVSSALAVETVAVSSGVAAAPENVAASVAAIARPDEIQWHASVAAHAARAAEKMGEFATRAAQSMAAMGLREKFGAAAEPARRVTAPPPEGALHSDGRRVVRDARDVRASEYWDGDRSNSLPSPRSRGRIIAIAGAATVAVVLAAYVFHKPASVSVVTNEVPAAVPPDLTALAAQPVEAAHAAASDPLVVHVVAPGTPSAPVAALQTAPPQSLPVAPVVLPGSTSVAIAPSAPVAMTTAPAFPQQTAFAKPASSRHATPFSNGPVGHGVTMRIKMDGPIGQIQGAHEATGFVVQVPDRHTVKPTDGLALRDHRIAAMHMTNSDNGSELKVAFRDGVPNYQVRANGDVLEVVVADRGAKQGKHQVAVPAHPKHKAHHPISLGHQHPKKPHIAHR